MRKRLLAMLLVLAMALSCTAQAKTEPDEPVQVKVKVCTYRNELKDIRGFYYDDGFYVTPETFGILAGADVTASEPKKASFSFFSGIMTYTVELDGSSNLPTLSIDGKLYLSLPHALRSLGFDIVFASAADKPVHMAVYRPYTVLDGMAEYQTSDDVRFSWGEADGVGKTVRCLSALDTIFFGYDPDIFRYSADALGVGSVEEQVILDVLYMILANGGTQYELPDNPWQRIFSTDPDVINVLSGTVEMGKYFAKRMGEEGLEHIGVLDEVLGVSYLDAVGAIAGFTADQFQAAEMSKQYFNMAETNKTLLENSLCIVSKGAADYKQWPSLFRAADDAQKMMDGTYQTKDMENLFLNLWKTGLSIAADPPATAWAALMSILKYDSLTQNLVGKEKNVAYADVSGDIQIIAHSLVGQTFSRLTSQDNPPERMVTEMQQQLRAQMILALKASLTAREQLIESGWLKQEAQAAMETRCSRTAALLNRLMNAEILIADRKPVVDEDLTWIADLAASGGFGYVVEYQGDVYYWKYTTQSFNPDGNIGSQSFQENVKNQMVRRAPDGTETVMFEALGHDEFAIANDRVFYRGSGGIKVCDLDGKNEAILSSQMYIQSDCATSDGAYLFYQVSDGIAVIDTAQETFQILVPDANLITVWDGVVYYQPHERDSEAALRGQMTVSKILPDGTEQALLHTTEADLYDDSDSRSSAMIGQMYFAEDYIYFSYGSIAGSGMFFQGGKIIRMRYDGSEAQVVAGEPDRVAADFIINGDGSVTWYPASESKALSYSMVQYEYQSDGTVYRYDRTSGIPVKLLDPADYVAAGPGLAGVEGNSSNGYKDILIQFTQETDGKLYYLAHSRARESGAPWWGGYTRTSSAFMVKDLNTGQVETLYTF